MNEAKKTKYYATNFFYNCRIFLPLVSIKYGKMKQFILILITMSFSFIGKSQFITYPPEIMGGNYNYKIIYDQEFYYPLEARNQGLEGEVKVSFMVGIDGLAYNFEVIESVSPELDSAFIKVLELCTYIPGNKDGRTSAMTMTKSNSFKIKKYDKLVNRRGYDQPPYHFTPYSESVKIVSYKQLQTPPKAYYKEKEVNVFEFIQNYIKIPDAAVKQGISGVVEIEFVIEPSGRLTNFKEIVGIGGGCTEEAYRLMGLMDWEPGKQNNEYVRSSYHIKVNFGNKKY